MGFEDVVNIAEETKDPDTGQIKKVYKVKRKKNTTPICNKEGIERIVSLVEKVINNHSVQGNKNREEYSKLMLDFSQDLDEQLFANRLNWAMSVGDTSIMVDWLAGLIDLFLSRTIDNKERDGYGTSYRENTNIDQKNEPKKPFWQPMLDLMTGSSKRGRY